MKFENTEVFNFEGAIRGMRNPLESWEKSDSVLTDTYTLAGKSLDKLRLVELGKNDLELMQRLIKAGSEHRKFMRQIFVSVDITAPLYWWKEFDTYKIGTVANSTSTMHKLASTPITKECFEMGDFLDVVRGEGCFHPVGVFWDNIILYLETLRQSYNKTKNKTCWKELIRLLPESWLQTRTVTMNYENILNMVHQRKNHKLTEWSVDFIEWAKSLPYADELLFLE